jgi:predicted regulator of Ras-like GTPase activity (Roadblock/LC7/MglB family)
MQYLQEVVQRLLLDANAKTVFLMDKKGQQLVEVGAVESLDTTSLTSLTGGNPDATDRLALLVNGNDVSFPLHESESEHVLLSIIANCAILFIIFDERSSHGLVRLRVKRAKSEFEKIFAAMVKKDNAEATAFSAITQEDIDLLFSR